MSSKGLPGFLRRSRRRDFEESEDEDYFSSDDDDDHGSSNHPSAAKENTIAYADTNVAANNSDVDHSPNTPDGNPNKTEEEIQIPVNDGYELKEEETTKSPTEYLPSTDNSRSIIAKISVSGSLGTGKRASLERRLSYRESKFDAIIGADTVKMADLRLLGWNGIPVRSFIYTLK
jgi:hypothetical protein